MDYSETKRETEKEGPKEVEVNLWGRAGLQIPSVRIWRFQVQKPQEDKKDNYWKELVVVISVFSPLCLFSSRAYDMYLLTLLKLGVNIWLTLAIEMYERKWCMLLLVEAFKSWWMILHICTPVTVESRESISMSLLVRMKWSLPG